MLPRISTLSARRRGIDVASTWKRVDEGVLIVGFGRDASSLDGDDPRAVEARLRALPPRAGADRLDLARLGRRPLRGRHLGWLAARLGDHRACRRSSPPRPPLLFAGSETAQRWPGFMEGAVESGFRILAAIAANRSQPAAGAR